MRIPPGFGGCFFEFLLRKKLSFTGTSNWSGDYFERTAGSALVVKQTGGAGTVGERLREVFERDWSSQYSVDIGDTERWESVCGSRKP